MKRFRVNILGNEFEVRSDAPESKVHEIAGYVDDKMRQAISQGRSKSPEKAAVLAALNIAEEYFREVDSTEKTRKEVEDRSDRLLDLIRSELNGDS